MDKLSLIFSDIEIGAGDVFDDFIEDSLFYNTIESHFSEAKKHDSEIILNGDIIDFMKSPYNNTHPRHITEKISVSKLKKIAKAHPKFFKVLKEWLENSKYSKVVFIIGNHDLDIIFPKVQEKIKEYITKDKELHERILFPGFEYDNGILLAEHGSQFDTFFKVDPANLISEKKIKYTDYPFLHLPWGYNGVYDYFIKLKKELPLMEKLHPREKVLELLPLSFKRRIMFGSAFFLLKSFFYTQFKYYDDPLYRFPIAEFMHYASSLFKKQFELIIEAKAKRKIIDKDHKILAVGHSHTPGVHTTKNGTVLNSGHWTEGYSWSRKFKSFVPHDKTYGRVIHNKKRLIQSGLITIPSTQEWIPKSKLIKTYKRQEKKINNFFDF